MIRRRLGGRCECAAYDVEIHNGVFTHVCISNVFQIDRKSVV